MERSYEEFSQINITTLKSLAFDELHRMLNDVGMGKYKVFEHKLIAICLCQGVAQHIVETRSYEKFDYTCLIPQNEIEERSFKVDSNGAVLSGIKDIDVWFFFEEDENVKIPDIKNMRKTINFNFPGIGEKKVDFLKKAIGKVEDGFSPLTPKESIIKYITTRNTSTAKHLKRKSIIGLYPEGIDGQVLWAVKREKQA
jgi:hypothetical protein